MAAAGHDLILDFTLVLGISAAGGYVAHRLRQPALLGYIISGVVIGPFGLGLLSEVEQIQALAEIGVAFLLFALGVEFSIANFRRVKRIALQGSLMQIGGTMALVTIAVVAFGWVDRISEGIFLGAVISLSSTAVVLKTLAERGETNTLHGQIMLAILIAQDLALGVMLALLPTLNQPEDFWSALGGALLKISLFIVGAIAIGRWVVPRVIRAVAKTESSELFLLTTIALCLSVALVTAALGLSIEMGAFVAGLMLSEVEYSDHALVKVLPLRDTFASLFFASIGMLIDPGVLAQNFALILGLVSLAMVGKALIILPIILSFGYSPRTAITSSFGLNQIGEFSFVLALMGQEIGLIERNQYLLLLGTTAITLVLTPAWINLATLLTPHLDKIPLLSYLRRFSDPKDLLIPDATKDHVVVAGYGRVGQVIVNILRSQGYPLLVIDNSEAAIQRLRLQKIPYIFGDADAEPVMERAHLETAKALAIALPDPGSTRRLLQRSLEVAPDLDVIARSHTDKEIDLLAQMGAREVVQPEFEAALELGAHVLLTMGLSEQEMHDVVDKIRDDRYRSIRPS
ncbi:MAG: cation:proton antiporter [Elainellaceae cyanobacterium]